MQRINKNIMLILVCLLFATSSVMLEAATKTPVGKSKNKKEQVQRTPKRFWDQQQNTVSNIQFYTTNYGIFGLNVEQNVGGGFWPRGSQNQYIFGGGIWFGATKRKPGDTTFYKYVEISYNPNNGRSWMTPGRIEDGDKSDESEIYKYRTYFSTDFRQGDGKPLDPDDGPNWPIWDSSPNDKDTLKVDRYFGYYILDSDSRNSEIYPKGPAFISGEDIVCVYKDTDLDNFDGGYGFRKNLGYPLKLQFEQYIYSWGFGDYKDFIFLRYDIINYSQDTLYNCWMAPVLDIDIARAPQTQAGAANDRTRFCDEEDTLNLAFQWTEYDQGEQGFGFGYLGFDFLESPAVDDFKMVRKDKKYYDNAEQLGLKTFRNWPIDQDINDDEGRYNYLASNVIDGDKGRGDNRFMMATGPFHMRSAGIDGVTKGDTVRVVIGIILAGPAVKKEGDGSWEDIQELIRKDKFAQDVYNQNFRAPNPPDRANITNWKPLNNAMKIQWDNQSELSKDIYEKGLDFLGYKIYRGRRTNLDTFDVNYITGNNEYPSGKGPMGWKQVARYELPTPFYKSTTRAGEGDNESFPFIDSLRIMGPVVNDDNTIDTFAIRVMRVGRGVVLAGPDKWLKDNSWPLVPIVYGIDTSYWSKPWGPYYQKLCDEEGKPFPLIYNPYQPTYRHQLLDDVILGKVILNSSLLLYNPLFWKKETVNVNKSDTATLPVRDGEYIYLKDTYKDVIIGGTEYLTIDRMAPRPYSKLMDDTTHLKATLDSIYHYIKIGIAKVSFPDFEQSLRVRTEVISPYMDSITNHRTFFDVGDDNNNAYMNYDADPEKTERIINNVDYYYKVLAYDEGDYSMPTPQKVNNAFPGLPNLATVYSKEESAGKKSEFQITFVDSSKIGGLYNFKFWAIDQERAQQLFGGHTLELEFQPYHYLSQLQFAGDRNYEIGLYQRWMTLKDLTTNDILFSGISMFEETCGQLYYRNAFTENTVSYILSDEVILDSTLMKDPDDIDAIKRNTFALRNSNEKRVRSGYFTTGDFLSERFYYTYYMNPPAYSTIGFSFDFTMEQWGGKYRPDSTTMIPSEAEILDPNKVFNKTPINIVDMDDIAQILTTQVCDFETLGYQFSNGMQGYGRPIYGSFNNGPAVYRVTFEPGGVETMKLKFGGIGSLVENTFNVPYLNMKVENVISYKRPVTSGSFDSVDVTYGVPINHIDIDTSTGIYYPTPLTIKERYKDFVTGYNLSGYGWVNGRTGKQNPVGIKKYQTYRADGPLAEKEAYLGTQGRYYLSCFSVDGKDTLDFVNVMWGSGVQFVFDYANKGRRFYDKICEPIDQAQYIYGEDFKVGDQVLLKTFGGALGYPLPGATVRCYVTPHKVADGDYTDPILDQIKVVPNPYYVSHQGQKSPYDAKIYFTKLPARCTIDIYTLTGDKVTTLEHDENSYTPEEEAIEVWDLLTKNKQRVQSQTLVAVITTPNGAQTIKNFTLVVGGFRLVTE